jgi:hypothetical protein
LANAILRLSVAKLRVCGYKSSKFAKDGNHFFKNNNKSNNNNNNNNNNIMKIYAVLAALATMASVASATEIIISSSVLGAGAFLLGMYKDNEH